MPTVELHRRFLPLEYSDAENDTFELSFSSELPVSTALGEEILDHSDGAVDLTRMNDGAPLLFNHHTDQLLGAVQSAQVINRRGVATVRWGTSPEAAAKRQDVAAGVLRNVSVGYQVDDSETDQDGRIRVTKWTPVEVSLVTVPSDNTVGIGRSLTTNTSDMTSLTDVFGRTIQTAAPARDEFERETDEFSVVRALQAAASGNWSAAGREREISQELELRTGRRTQGFFVPQTGGWQRRDYVKGTASAGGNYIGTQHLADNFVEALRARLAVAELGATMLPGLIGDVAIPRRSGSASTYWIAESANITESTGTVDQITLNPKVVGCFSKFSHLMKLQATPEIEQVIRQDFIALIAQAIDSVAIKGGGSGEPTGILETSGIGSVAGGTDGAAPTIDNILDLKAEVAVDNADQPTCGFLTNSKVEKVISKLKDGNSAYHLSPYVGALEDQRIANRRLLISNNVPSNLTKGSGSNLSAIIYGNFADLIIGMWGALEVEVDPYSAFQSGTVGVRAMQAIDIGVRHPESFAAMTDAIA